MRKCIKCNKEKLEDEFYANWSHWCNDCIDKRKRDMEYKEFMRNGGIDGKENKMLRKRKKELEEFKIRNTFPFKYFIIDYSIFLKRYVIVNVSLDEERDDGKQWYFVLSDEEGWEYQKEIQEIYGIEDLKYLEEKVNKINKEREEK